MAATTNYHKLIIKQQKLKTKQNRTNKNSETYSLTVLEARSSKSKGHHGWFLLEALKGSLFHASPLASTGLLAILVLLGL